MALRPHPNHHPWPMWPGFGRIRLFAGADLLTRGKGRFVLLPYTELLRPPTWVSMQHRVAGLLAPAQVR